MTPRARSSRARTALVVAFLTQLACWPDQTAENEPRRSGPARRPNVLLYVIDTLRADGLAPYGNRLVATPHASKLAREGVVYERAYSTSAWTRPAIASLLTGLPPDVHGVETRAHRAPSALVFLAERYRDAGYRTGAIVTNPNVGAYFGFDQGYHEFIELFDHEGGGVVETDSWRATSAAVSERAIEWIDADDRPFFLFLLTTDPHSPYAPPDSFDLYRDASLSDLAIEKSTRGARKVAIETKRKYYGEIAFNDASFGSLLDHLESRALHENTVVVLTADHGEQFGERGAFGHGNSLFQELVHVPLIVRGPGIGPPGTRVATATQITAIHATLARLSNPPLSDGERLAMDDALPLPGSEPSRPQRLLYARIDLDRAHGEMILQPPWKLILPIEGKEATVRLWPRLYDLESDPEETTSHLRTSPAVVERLKSLLAQRRAEIAPLSRAIQEAASAEQQQAREAGVQDEIPDDVQRALEALGYVDE